MYPAFKISRIHLFDRIVLTDRLTELSVKIDALPKCFIFYVRFENMSTFITLLEQSSINTFTFIPASHSIERFRSRSVLKFEWVNPVHPAFIYFLAWLPWLLQWNSCILPWAIPTASLGI